MTTKQVETTEGRDSRTLLAEMLETITSHKRNPLMAQRALRSVVRGEINTRDFQEMRDVTHAIFDWMCEFNKDEISKEDQALLDIDVEAIGDERERIQASRAQRKALRRARIATASKQSKVDSTVVEAVAKRIEASYSRECAADVLWFASGLIVDLKPAELIEFLERTVAVKSSWWHTGDVHEWSKLVKEVHEHSIVKYKVDLWVGIYLAGHTWNLAGLQGKKGLSNEQVLAIHQAKSRKQDIAEHYLTPETQLRLEDYQRVLGRPARRSMLAAHVTAKDLRTNDYMRTLTSACDVGYIYKGTNDYRDVCRAVIEGCDKARRKSSDLKVAEIWELLYIDTKEFKLPDYAVFTDYKIGNVVYTTVVDEDSLRRNGDYMGNCTYSAYHRRYRDGQGVLFIAEYQGDRYNIDLSVLGGRWSLREVRGRHGRMVPKAVGASISVLVEELRKIHQTHPATSA